MSDLVAEPSEPPRPLLFVFNGSTQHRYGDDCYRILGITFGKSLFHSREPGSVIRDPDPG